MVQSISGLIDLKLVLEEITIKQMPENKPFTEEEDRTIKFLFQELKIKKWAIVAKIMTEDYQMPRNAKQCRDRYQQFLDPFMQAEWTVEEQRLLFYLHGQIGNKWALISTYFSGKTDNCVKNHFFSKLRKALRFMNRIIRTYLKRDFRELKIAAIYKIIEGFEEQFKEKPIIEKEMSKYCGGLKDAILYYANEQEIDEMGDFGKEKILFQKINDFARNYRKRSKKQRREALQGVQLFKPIQKISQVEEEQSDFSQVQEEEESEGEQKDVKVQKIKQQQNELLKSQAIYVLVEDEELRGSNQSKIEIRDDMLGSSGRMCSVDALKFPDFLHNSGSIDKANYPFAFLKNQSSFKSYRSERSLISDEPNNNLNTNNRVDILGDHPGIRLSDTLKVVGEDGMDEQMGDQDIFRSQRQPIFKYRQFC